MIHTVMDLRADEVWETATVGILVVGFIIPAATVVIGTGLLTSLHGGIQPRRSMWIALILLGMSTVLIIMGNILYIFIVQATLPYLIGSEWILYAGLFAVLLLILNTIFYRKTSTAFDRLTVFLPAIIILLGISFAGYNMFSGNYTVVSYEDMRINALLRRNTAEEDDKKSKRVSTIVRECNVQSLDDISSMKDSDGLTPTCKEALKELQDNDVSEIKVKKTEKKLFSRVVEIPFGSAGGESVTLPRAMDVEVALVRKNEGLDDILAWSFVRGKAPETYSICGAVGYSFTGWKSSSPAEDLPKLALIAQGGGKNGIVCNGVTLKNVDKVVIRFNIPSKEPERSVLWDMAPKLPPDTKWENRRAREEARKEFRRNFKVKITELST